MNFAVSKTCNMPELSEILNVLLLRDYNTRLVVICTLLLGCACGLMGGFLLLRKRSLMGDTAGGHLIFPINRAY